MKKGIGRRKILVPVICVLLVMTAAFILIMGSLRVKHN